MNVPSYPEIIQLGSPGTVSFLFSKPVIAQEKVDGSQFRWGVIDNELCFASHHQQFDLDQIPSMFAQVVSYLQGKGDVLRKILAEGQSKAVWFYGEMLTKPKQNTLVYGRIPTNGLVLFDVVFESESGERAFAPRLVLEDCAARLGVSVVPQLAVLYNPSLDDLKSETWFDTESFLGGTTIEGVVFKDYTQQVVYGGIPQPIIAKWVSQRFKEHHKTDWKERSDKGGAEALVASYESVEARWRKAVQHFAEDGLLTCQPKDIGPLIGEITKDIFVEDEEAIKEALWKIYRKEIARVAVKGFAEWYKANLAELSETYGK